MSTTASTVRTPAEVYAGLNVHSNYSSTTNKATEQQTRFLKLLTAQLRNQDPTAPMDNAQMTSQLAQISTVDGIERLNQTLQSLVSDSQTSQGMQAALLLGRGVLVPGSTTTLVEGQAVAGFELAGDADKVTVEVRDANGLLMKTLNLGAQTSGVHGFMWDGKTTAGADAAAGNYSFTLKASNNGAEVKATRLAYGAVSGVANVNGGSGAAMVSVAGLGDFATSEIRRIM